MNSKYTFTSRAEDALEATRAELTRWPNRLASAALLGALDAAGPSLARGVFTALEVSVADVLARAREIRNERGAELAARRLRSQPASLELLVRRAHEEAAMLGQCRIATAHLLLAMLSVHDDPTTTALRLAGVTQDTVRGTLRRLIASWTDEGEPRPSERVA